MEISTTQESIIIKGVYEKPIIIPSRLFPFSGQLEVFYHGNTEECVDTQIKHIFNNMPIMKGDCYGNTDYLTEAFENANFPKERYKTYRGWMFIGETLPIHHVFTVVDGKYMLDFSEQATCGRVSTIFMYVGSIEKPKVGRILLRKLAKEYHKHQEEFYE